MSARDKLNAAYAAACAMIAALLGAVFQSWLVFALATLVLIALCLVNGTIRPRRRK